MVTNNEVISLTNEELPIRSCARHGEGLKTMRKIFTFVMTILFTCCFLSCNDSPQTTFKPTSVDEDYKIGRRVERETGMYQGVCTNEAHRYDVDYCTKYVGEKTKYGICVRCGCSRYAHWGDVGLE